MGNAKAAAVLAVLAPRHPAPRDTGHTRSHAVHVGDIVTRRPSTPRASDRLVTPSVEECLRAIGEQLALVADVLRLQAQTEPDDGLRPEAMHALSSVCDVALADVTALRRCLPVATLNLPARPANGC